MIPILYPANEASKSTSLAFKTNGIGRLSDAATCVVTEKRNAEYELEMTYPIDGIHFEDIKVDMFIDVIPSENGTLQHFRIYDIEEPIDDVVTIRAEHVSYLLNKAVVLPFTANSANGAWLQIANNVQWNSAAKTFRTFPFDFWSDNNTTGTVTVEAPTSVRSVLGGTEGSILDACGGEYEFDNFTVKLHGSRGSDTGITLRYGKNITDLTNTYDISESYTGILPYWKGNLDVTSESLDEEGNIITESVETVIYVTSASQNKYKTSHTSCTNYLNGKTLWIANTDNIYAYPLSIPVDLSSMEIDDYEEPELEQGEEESDEDYAERLKTAKINAEATYKAYVLEELTNKSNEYLNDNASKSPKNTIKLSFVQLWNTTEYEDIAPLEHVNLCDKVNVYYPEFGINVKTKVVETEYNVLLDRYDSITLGDVINGAAENILTDLDDTSNLVNQLADSDRTITTIIKAGIERATNLITGGLGGYVVINKNAAGQPNELLIMDKPSKSTARNVWRWNLGGLGFSNNGYNGPFDKIALTMNGEINASRILTGIMDATRIRTGIIQDVKNYNYWDLDSGEFRMAATTYIGTGNDTVASKAYSDTTANSAAETAITTYDTVTLNQTRVFNKLTSNGTIKGLYMQDGQLYINATYVSSGTFKTADVGNNVRVLMEGSTAALKGYYNTTLISLIDMVNGTNTSTAKMVLDTKNGFAIRTPKLLVINESKGTGSGTCYKGVTGSVQLPYYFAAYGSDGKIGDCNVYMTYMKFVDGIYVGNEKAYRYNFGMSTADSGGGSAMVLQGSYTSNWPYPYSGEIKASDNTEVV